jgi:hypothetical protein
LRDRSGVEQVERATGASVAAERSADVARVVVNGCGGEEQVGGDGPVGGAVRGCPGELQQRRLPDARPAAEHVIEAGLDDARFGDPIDQQDGHPFPVRRPPSAPWADGGVEGAEHAELGEDHGA